MLYKKSYSSTPPRQISISLCSREPHYKLEMLDIHLLLKGLDWKQVKNAWRHPSLVKAEQDVVDAVNANRRSANESLGNT